MLKRKVPAMAIKSFTLLVVLGTVCLATAQNAKTTYPSMAPVEEYLGTDPGAEIALARTAAPESISRDAEVLGVQGVGVQPVVGQLEHDARGRRVPRRGDAARSPGPA